MVDIGIIREDMSRLRRRAAVDGDFRRACLEDAGAAYLELTGRPLPQAYAVRFFEQGRDVSADGGARWVRLPPLLPRTWLG